MILAVFVLRSFLFEPFKIPSGSMIPTLLVGDLILVNKFAYGVRLPVLNTKITDGSPPQRSQAFASASFLRLAGADLGLTAVIRLSCCRRCCHAEANPPQHALTPLVRRTALSPARRSGTGRSQRRG